MFVRAIDVEKLIEWLGREGAIAGLEGSDITVPELYDIAVHCGLTVEKKMRRSDIIIDLVNRDVVRIDKTIEDILAMNHNVLREYLKDRKVSRTELLHLLSKLDIRPGREANTNLVDFVAREISDLGMYQRVAKGTRGKSLG